MNKKYFFSHRVTAMLLTLTLCLSMIPTAFAGQQNSYHDPSVKGPQVFYYETSGEGKELAADLQESLNTTLEVERPREIKGNTSYYLLKRSKGVLVIAECGFLTNPKEEAQLLTPEYQTKIAAVLSCALSRTIG